MLLVKLNPMYWKIVTVGYSGTQIQVQISFFYKKQSGVRQTFKKQKIPVSLEESACKVGPELASGNLALKTVPLLIRKSHCA